jgi:hypothetical protein
MNHYCYPEDPYGMAYSPPEAEAAAYYDPYTAGYDPMAHEMGYDPYADPYAADYDPYASGYEYGLEPGGYDPYVSPTQPGEAIAPQQRGVVYQRGIYQRGVYQRGIYQRGIDQRGFYQRGVLQRSPEWVYRPAAEPYEMEPYADMYGPVAAKPPVESAPWQRGVVYQRGIYQRGVHQRGIYQRGIDQRGFYQRGVLQRSPEWVYGPSGPFF